MAKTPSRRKSVTTRWKREEGVDDEADPDPLEVDDAPATGGPSVVGAARVGEKQRQQGSPLLRRRLVHVRLWPVRAALRAVVHARVELRGDL